MLADFLSRNVATNSWEQGTMAEAQRQDPLITGIKNFLMHREVPMDPKCQALVKLLANDCFVENDILWRRIKRQFEPGRVVVFLPDSLKSQVLQSAHGDLLAGHDGLYKTKERIFQCYFWPGMDQDIQNHLQSCHNAKFVRNIDLLNLLS